jgi:hypothetical protein
MAMQDTFTAARDDWTQDDLPGWTPQEIEEAQRIQHCDKLAARLEARGIRKRVTEMSFEYHKGDE